MGTRRRSDDGDPRQHTAIIGDVRSMWHKLVWDIDQFNEIQRGHQDVKEPLAYAAINVCIAASSLADWVIDAYVKRRRSEGHPTTDSAVRRRIYAAVHGQQMCEAIANTAKHARLRPGVWPNGSVRIDWEEPSEVSPGVFILRHIHDGVTQSVAQDAFDVLQRCWWGELQSLGFPFPGNLSDAAWWQQKIDNIFGRRD